MIVVLWGVSGCGKTTVGSMLAQRLDGSFIDADDFHPSHSRAKMKAGMPLTDADRLPWLHTLADKLRAAVRQNESVVLACSALKKRYRVMLTVDSAVQFVHLQGAFEVIELRLTERQHAFMNNALLASQFEALEPDSEGLQIDIGLSPEKICDLIMAHSETARDT